MRIQDWDRWRRDRETSSSAVDQFSRACQLQNGFGYEAGWWSSTVKRLLMELPREKRNEEIRLLLAQAKDLEQQHLIQTLKKEPA